MFLNVIEKVEMMKRMVLRYLLSAATAYLTINFLMNIFFNLINNFSLSVI